MVVTGGRAAVDLSAQVASATPQALDRMRQQLVATLDVADATISAEGIPVQISSSGSPATIDPQPGGAVLVGTTGTEFGFGSSTGIAPVPGVSDAVVGDGATAVSLGRDQSAAAYLAGDGTVRRIALGSDPVTVDARPGLVAPSLDGFGWTWSAGAGSPLDAFSADGEAAGIVADAIPADASVVALAVSRDSRVCSWPSRAPPVRGSSRSGSSARMRGRWASTRRSSCRSRVRSTESPGWTTIPRSSCRPPARRGPRSSSRSGAPGRSLGPLGSLASAVGGRGGVAGIRALADGAVFAPGGTGGWNRVGFDAAFLGVQQ